MLSFCEVTNESLSEAFNEDISFIFYIVSYVIAKNKEQEKMIKKWKNS